MTSVSGTRWFASFDQSNEKTLLMPSVSEHKYFELNLLDFRLISEVNLSISIFPQRCSRILIKLWAVYQLSKSIILEILLSSFLYYCPIQKTSKCMLWSKVRLKMFKANLWIWVLLLPHFIIYWVTKLSVYQKIHLFSNFLIEESKRIECYFLYQWDFCNKYFLSLYVQNAGNSSITCIWMNVE